MYVPAQQVPNGNKVEATWFRGKLTSSALFFEDQLQYQPDNWSFCTEQDRRFQHERLHGLRPAGQTQAVRNPNGPARLPEQTYDVGDGYYDNLTGLVHDFAGQPLRTPSQAEAQFYLQYCRYSPKSLSEKQSGVLLLLSQLDDDVVRAAVDEKQDKPNIELLKALQDKQKARVLAAQLARQQSDARG